MHILPSDFMYKEPKVPSSNIRAHKILWEISPIWEGYYYCHAAEDSSLLGHYTMSTAKQLQMFQRHYIQNNHNYLPVDAVITPEHFNLHLINF